MTVTVSITEGVMTVDVYDFQRCHSLPCYTASYASNLPNEYRALNHQTLLMRVDTLPDEILHLISEECKKANDTISNLWYKWEK